MAGQSINDRLTAARYSLAGQGLAKSVCKATTEEVIGPKKKHLDYLLHCTNEPNVSIPQLANLLIERSQMQSWVSVFKALITVHHLMCYGNERFTQYLASSNCNFNLGGFLDKTGATDQPQLSYDMSTFIRRYAKYINEKAISYRSVAFDFCKTKRGKEDGTLRTMSTDTLLKTLPILQAQLDALLDFDCTSSELNNGVINAAFLLLFRDLIRLFACYNDGIINLLEKYFEMNKKQARDALDCYKKFLIRMDRVSEFLKVAEAIGMDKSEIPDLKQAPSSLLDALEAHLASLEGKKAATTTNSSNGRIGEATPTGANGTPSGMDEVMKRAALAEEEAMYEKLKQEHGKNNPFLSPSASESSAPTAVAATSSSTTAPLPSATNQIVDLFGGVQSDPVPPPTQQAAPKASDDLLQLGNPFADILSTTPSVPPPLQHPAQQPYTNDGDENPFSDMGIPVAEGGQGIAPGAEILVQAPPQSQNSLISAFDGFGDILKPEGKGVMPNTAGGVTTIPTSALQQPSQPQKLISGDLDMSLSSLVDNLNIKGPTQKPQWNSPKAQSKTGGTGWSPAMSTTTGAYRPPGPMGNVPNPQWPAGGVGPQPNSAFAQPATSIMTTGPPPITMTATFPPQSQLPPQQGLGAVPVTSTPATSAFDPLGSL